VPDTTYFFAAWIVRANGSIQAGIHSGRAPVCATGRPVPIMSTEPP
jgi:hypothetical protein